MDRMTYDTGFGILPKSVMTDTRISIQAKGVFAYLVTFAGNGTTAFPKRETIMHHLGIGKDSLSKYLKELKNSGYLEVEQVKTDKGRFSHNVYKLIPCPKLSDTETPYPENLPTNINSSLIKTKKNNICAIEQVDALWKLYPRKKGKAMAYKKIPKLISKYGYEQIERCIKRYVDEVKDMHKDKQYIMIGSTFLNGRYEDYLDENYEETKAVVTQDDDGFGNLTFI